MENVYQQGEESYAVDAKAIWSWAELGFTLRGDADTCPRYQVAAFVAHETDADVDARQRMRSGHNVAYTLNGDQWFQLNDKAV